ncbi:alcohol dehydrogenase, propanol-preferring [Geosmithia morbida]|uniref:Alcohol dehydrogenase, propanol-preferring n=1 Tax=Geosmithia morbida TaxID=1094350 RepID=A0A9P4YS71_9HYPO|nr:alcohol dehydrogenase, propanol-preferring [Geosmithia morbida]KAF4120029.1 alcohol dehydrogenase, propanol-preferring [Geosmithia morbida]
MASIPKKHQAMIYDKPGSVSTKMVEVDTPNPGPGEVLIKISHSGVCHSDLSVMLNAWPVLPPLPTDAQVGGHEGVGIIVKFGPSCDKSHLELGARVGIKWVASACLNCDPCMAGADAQCKNLQISGYSCPGTFQEYVLAPLHYVTPIPDGLDSAMAAPMLCGGLTVYSALRKSRAQPGDWVAVSGAGGGLGHLALQVGKAMGFRMLGLDMAFKEKLIIECGAEKFVDIKDEDVPKTVLSHTNGQGVASVIVCNASNDAYASAMDLLKFNGTLVCVGIPDGTPIPVAKAFPVIMVFRQFNIVGSAVGNRREAVEILDMASRGLVKTHYTVRPMEELGKTFEEMTAGKIRGRVVLEI